MLTGAVFKKLDQNGVTLDVPEPWKMTDFPGNRMKTDTGLPSSCLVIFKIPSGTHQNLPARPQAQIRRAVVSSPQDGDMRTPQALANKNQLMIEILSL